MSGANAAKKILVTDETKKNSQLHFSRLQARRQSVPATCAVIGDIYNAD
ncbi:MAG: hypothetical protein IKP64_08605 [Selenomonadaceae bacterium]|nr:hypothetical protein [Selenomonadaceae bacterium]